MTMRRGVSIVLLNLFWQQTIFRMFTIHKLPYSFCWRPYTTTNPHPTGFFFISFNLCLNEKNGNFNPNLWISNFWIINVVQQTSSSLCQFCVALKLLGPRNELSLITELFNNLKIGIYDGHTAFTVDASGHFHNATEKTNFDILKFSLKPRLRGIKQKKSQQA